MSTLPASVLPCPVIRQRTVTVFETEEKPHPTKPYRKIQVRKPGGKKSKEVRTAPCGRHASRFFRVFYDIPSLNGWRREHAVGGTVFALCAECAVGRENPAAWDKWGHGKTPGQVVRQLGRVIRVEEIASEEQARDEKREAFFTSVKQQVWRIMDTKWTSKISHDEWKRLLSEAVDEFDVRKVMQE